MGLFAGCDTADTALDRENIIGLLPDGGALPDGGLPQDIAADSVAQSVRDAVVRTHTPPRTIVVGGVPITVGGTCGAILITPRVVASAAHCGPADRVAFGQSFVDFDARPLPDPAQVGVDACIVHPQALDLAATSAPSCADMMLFPGQATSLDWQLLLLDRRVDAAAFATTIAATPAGVLDAPLPSPAVTITPLFWADIEHDVAWLDAGVPGVDAGFTAPVDRARGRVFADVTFAGVGPELAGPFAGRGDYTSFGDDGTMIFLGVFFGDPGSPFYVGDPDHGIQLVTVTSEGRDYPGNTSFNPNVLGSRPAWDSDVRAFTSQVLDCSDGCTMRSSQSAHEWYVGPADYPATGVAQPGDADGDGLREDLGHDDCPFAFDPDQADRDRDGVGDACDNCAPSPTGDARAATNPAQENCNLDAEIAAGYCDPRGQDCRASASRALGDACDPVPCARTYLELGATEPLTLGPVTIQLDPVVAAAGPIDGLTGFRYCRCDAAAGDAVLDGTPAVRTRCASPTRIMPCAIAGDRLGARSQYDTSEADPSHLPAWRHVTTTRTDPSPSPDVVEYHPYSAPSGAPPTYHWSLWTDDVPRWSRLYSAIDPAPTPTEPVPGVLWTHSPHDCASASRCPAPTADPITRALRSHYRSGQLGQLAVRIPSGPSCPGTGPIPVPCLALPVPGCHASLPSLGPICPPLGEWPWLVVMPATFAGLPPPVLALQYDGVGAIPAAASFPSLPPFTAADLSWTAVAEPLELLREDQDLRYVGISSDGLQIASVLRSTAFGFTPADYNPGCDPNSAPDKCFPEIVAAGDPLFVLSASRAELFVIDTRVSAVDLDRGARRQIPIDGIVLGELLAATYDRLGDRLYVLDVVALPHGHEHDTPGSEVRLVAVDPDGEGAIVLARWPRRAHHTRFALGVGPGGQLYLAASVDERRHEVVSVSIAHHDADGHHAEWDDVRVRFVGAGEGAVGSTMLYAGAFDVSLAVDLPTHIEVRHYAVPSGAPGHERDAAADVF